MTHPTPDHSPESVRTPPVVPSCPICGKPLKGNQTVCSPKCRIERFRRKREANQREREAKVRLLLTEALGLLSEVNAPHGEAEGTGSRPDH
jgi:predicted nucleic acid-binding Zn ribbon protein